MTVDVAALGACWNAGAGHGAGAGRMPRGAALGWATVYCSISSICRARLMAATRDCEFYTCKARLSGGRRSPINSYTSCALSVIEGPGARQERLKAILVFRNRSRAAVVRKLEEGGARSEG